jgi:integrase
VAPRTKQLHFQNLKAAMRYAVRRGVMDADPTEFVRLPRVIDQEPRILTSSELRAIRSRCWTGQQRLLFGLLAYTGMRRAEVWGLKWEDVTPSSLRVIGKGGKLRHVPVHPALSEVLIRQSVSAGSGDQHVLCSGDGSRPLSEAGIWFRLKAIAPGVGCHDFRRTVATSLVENGVPEYQVDRIMGWAARTVGRRYYVRAASEQLQRAILKLYADDPL